MPPPLNSLAQMVRLIAFIDRNLLRKLQTVSASNTLATIVCYDSNQAVSAADRLMGADARRKTAFELVHVLDQTGKPTKRLPRCLFQALNASLRIKQQLRSCRSFFESLGRLGKIRVVVLPVPPAAEPTKPMPEPRPQLALISTETPEEASSEEESTPLVRPETPDDWDA